MAGSTRSYSECRRKAIADPAHYKFTEAEAINASSSFTRTRCALPLVRAHHGTNPASTGAAASRLRRSAHRAAASPRIALRLSVEERESARLDAASLCAPAPRRLAL